MPQPHIDPCRLQTVAHLHKQRKLPLGKFPGNLGIFIGDRKVGKYAGEVQPTFRRQFFNQRDGAGVFGLKAQPAHAGIDLDMAIHGAARAGSLLRQLQGVFLAEQRLGDGIAGQHRRRGGIGVAQHQNGAINPLTAQL